MFVHKNEVLLNSAGSRSWIFGFIAIALCVAIPMWWIAGSYYSIDVTGSLVFIANDGSCAGSVQQIGTHCFGDYAASASRSSSSNPWSDQNTYAPYLGASYLVFRLFVEVGNLLGGANTGLVLYLIASFCALAYPSLAIRKMTGLSWRLPIILILAGPISLPGLIALDRGNNVALVVPGLFIFLQGFTTDRRLPTVLGLVLSSVIKPQYVLLVGALLVVRRWKDSLVALLAVLVVQSLAFLAWPQSLFGGLFRSISMMLIYNDYASVSDQYPPQVSISKGIWEMLNFFGRTEGSIESSKAIQTLGGVSILLAFSFISFFAGRRRSNLNLGIIFVALVSLLPGTTWAYYSVFSIPVLHLWVMESCKSDNHPMGKRERTTNILIAVAIVITFVQFPRSFRVIDGYEELGVVSTTATLIPIAWTLVAIWSVIPFGRAGRREMVESIN